jgi:hypothetical protein
MVGRFPNLGVGKQKLRSVAQAAAASLGGNLAQGDTNTHFSITLAHHPQDASSGVMGSPER